MELSPLETYSKIILHPGCGLTGEAHSWDDCPVKYIYYRIAARDQKRLKAVGVAIGIWVNESKYKLVAR